MISFVNACDMRNRQKCLLTFQTICSGSGRIISRETYNISSDGSFINLRGTRWFLLWKQATYVFDFRNFCSIVVSLHK